MASLSGQTNYQELSDLGILLAGGRVYTYLPGTTTHTNVYTDAAGSVPHTYTSDGSGGQYIALNARGEIPGSVFVNSGGVDLVLKTAAGVTIRTRKAIGQNDQATTLDTAVRADLASNSDVAKGAGQVGFNKALAYLFGSVGEKINRRVDVNDYVTAGAGTLASPWTGWDTAITWTAKTTYVFRDGYYSYATSPNFAFFRLCLLGTGSTVIQHTGTGWAMSFDGGAVGDGVYRCEVHGIQLESNALASGGLDCRAIHHGDFDIEFRNIPTTVVRTRWFILNRCRFSHTQLAEGASVLPAVGLLMQTRTGAERSSANTFECLRMYNTSTAGLQLVAADDNTFLGGAVESNTGKGMTVDNDCLRNNLIGVDFEGNTGNDIEWGGSYGLIQGINSTRAVLLLSGAKNNLVQGGMYDALTLNSGSNSNNVIGVAVSQNGGAFTDSGTNNYRDGMYNITSTEKTCQPSATIASAGTISIPYGVKVALITGTTNITAITARDGQVVTLVFSGSLTIGGANVVVAGGTFATSNNDSLTLSCLGSNWFEAGRAVA